MTAWNRVSIANLLCRLILGGVFIWAGVTKIVNPGQFTALIDNYQIFPPAAVPALAVVLPWIELTCGLTLAVNRLTAGGALVATVLLAGFILLHITNLYRGIDTACGCFSLAGESSGLVWWSISRNLLLMGAGAWLLRKRQLRRSQARN